MSYGMTPYDEFMTPYEFVKSVYHEQEGVALDFWPTDDKYKEVLMTANKVQTEFQKDWDWSWLREQYVLGSTTDPAGPGAIPAYMLPRWVYKPMTHADDCVRLYLPGRCNRNHHHVCHCCDERCEQLDERNFIEAPFAPTSQRHHKRSDHISYGGQHFEHKPLGVVTWGREIHFNRPLMPNEQGRIAVVDVVRRLKPLHICNSTCRDKDGNIPSYTESDYRPCDQIEEAIWEDVPDPDYFVIRTAALRAPYSPPAAHREQPLIELARTRLSAMRDNDQQYTEPDVVERDWDIRTMDHIGGFGFANEYYPTKGLRYW